MPELFDLREEYIDNSINGDTLSENPFVQFEKWLNQAIELKLPEPNAFTLATTTSDGRPSARIVLLKYYNSEGFVFFTNYLSRKGKEIEENPNAAILFYWPGLQRQIRIEGKIFKTLQVVSDDYFNKRPLDSRIGACISPQSQQIPDRQYLEDLFNTLHQEKEIIKRPEYWGGYCLNPVYFEFWQGRTGRLHDRIFYQQVNNKWMTGRLAP